MSILKFISHSYTILNTARKYGWLPGARYTNLRDVSKFERLGFLDIDWKNYDFKRHLSAAASTQPVVTVARDVMSLGDLPRILDQAAELTLHADKVIVVPKDPLLGPIIEEQIPAEFCLGYSVPTKYGGTEVPLEHFRRPVHLLGGRPDVQRRLASQLPVFSIDGNRLTLDAAFGDYFDGEKFRPHPKGGYLRCIEASLENINGLWDNYVSSLA